MKRLFLTSSVGTPGVAQSVFDKIGNPAPLKTVFITTPVEPQGEQTDLEWYETDRKALKSAGFDFFDYTVNGKSPEDLSRDLADIDAIYVSGGNSRHLLYHSQLSGFDSFVRNFVSKGTPYIGTSAGSVVTAPRLPQYNWGEDDETPYCTNFESFDLVNFNFIPHWGSSWFKDYYLNVGMEKIFTQENKYILCNDYEYVEVVDDKFRIVDVRNKNE